MRSKFSHWSWYISAFFYRFSYIDIAHQIDDDLFDYLGDFTQGAVIADCGCGPGVVTEKFLERGAARVLAIDGNAGMLRQVYTRLIDSIAADRVVVIKAQFTPRLFFDLRNRFLEGAGFDIILFKRSLYLRWAEAQPVLKAAVEALTPVGIMVIIHPERSLSRYAFGPKLKLMPYTPYHLFNRVVSLLGRKLGLGEYTLYTQTELLDLIRTVAPERQIELIASRQQAYNLIAVRNGEFPSGRGL